MPLAKFDGTSHDIDFPCTHSNPKTKTEVMWENIHSGKEDRKWQGKKSTDKHHEKKRWRIKRSVGKSWLS